MKLEIAGETDRAIATFWPPYNTEGYTDIVDTDPTNTNYVALFLAAPKMLEVLESIAELYFDSGDPVSDEYWSYIDAVIKEAKG